MALVPVRSSASFLDRITRLSNLATEEDRNGKKQRGQYDDQNSLWIKTSLERIEHFLEAQKLSNYVSPPINLGEYARNMLVEHKLLTDKKGKEVGEGLRTRIQLEGVERRRKQTVEDTGTRVFGGASRGDGFFSKEEGQGDVKRDFSPNVIDFFGPKKNFGKAQTCKKKKEPAKRNKRSSKSEKPVEQELDFPKCPLRDFVLHGAEPHRISDRRYQIQNDATTAYMNERCSRQIRDVELRAPNLIETFRDFVTDVTIYPKADPRQVNLEDSRTTGTGAGTLTGIYKVEVLGSQALSSLRDAIVCDNDYIYLKELHHPDDAQDSEELAKNKLRSAMLLIDNTIYNESRWPNCFDYASQVINWTMQRPQKKVGPFKRGDMSATKVEDLTIQFGYPYVFRHLGNCEHVIVFNNARVLAFEDEYRVNYFPRTTWISKVLPTMCRIDNEFIATWAVMDHPEFPENPMLICTTCLISFCYTEIGEKKGSFRLFPYRQLTCEMPLPSESISPYISLSSEKTNK